MYLSVASVPMNNVKAALAEITRSVENLGARGIQVMTNVNGRPLDDPELAPIFELMHSYDLPIWMHPTRPQKFADQTICETDVGKIERYGCVVDQHADEGRTRPAGDP